MSSQVPLTVIIEDRQVPRVQAKLLAAAAARAGQPIAIRLTSEMDLPTGNHWKVKPEISARLAARIAVLKDTSKSGVSLFIDGNAMIVGDVAELVVAAKGVRFLAPPGVPLRDTRFFVVNYDVPLSPQLDKTLSELLKSTYDAAADYAELPGSPLPHEWASEPYGAMLLPKVVDLWNLGQRPWHAPYARAGELWSGSLLNAVREGAIALAEVRKDVEEGMLRYTALYQIEHSIVNPLRLPSGLLDLDREHQPPEARVMPTQREMLKRQKFAIPTRPGQPAPPRTLRDYLAFPWRVYKRAAGLLNGTMNFSEKEKKQYRKKWKQFTKRFRWFPQTIQFGRRQASRGLRGSDRLLSLSRRLTWRTMRLLYRRSEAILFRTLQRLRLHGGVGRTNLEEFLDSKRNFGHSAK